MQGPRPHIPWKPRTPDDHAWVRRVGLREAQIVMAEREAAERLADEEILLASIDAIRGLPGLPGEDGTNGRDGTDGTNGRDGVAPIVERVEFRFGGGIIVDGHQLATGTVEYLSDGSVRERVIERDADGRPAALVLKQPA